MKLKSARWEPRIVLFENDTVIDVAHPGEWDCAAEWAESILTASAEPFEYIGSNENGTVKTYKVGTETVEYRMETAQSPR